MAMMKSKMNGGPKQEKGGKMAQPCFPNKGDTSLTGHSKPHDGNGTERSSVAPTPKTIGGRAT